MKKQKKLTLDTETLAQLIKVDKGLAEMEKQMGTMRQLIASLDDDPQLCTEFEKAAITSMRKYERASRIVKAIQTKLYKKVTNKT